MNRLPALILWQNEHLFFYRPLAAIRKRILIKMFQRMKKINNNQ